MIATVDANNPNDYLSPIVRDHLARLAEARDASRAHELDAIDTPSTAFPSPEFDTNHNQSWWNPPPTRPNSAANPSSRWSVNNAPTEYRAYQPNHNLDNRISELSSIRYVHPSGTQEPPCSSQPGPVSPDPNPVSPDPNTFVSPLIGGISPRTPLMNRWHSDDCASVGQPSATVDGPVNWPSPLYLKSERGSGQEQGVSRSLTSATGGGAKYISPETAMAEGYSPGREEED